MKKNKNNGGLSLRSDERGMIRIIEAFIAVMLVAGVLVFVVNKNSSISGGSEKIYDIENVILSEVSQNLQFRSEILQNIQSPELKQFVQERSPMGYEVRTNICDLNAICPVPSNDYPENKDVYSRSTAITSNVTYYSPKQFKIFMWEK